jgi:hypothetical protein
LLFDNEDSSALTLAELLLELKVNPCSTATLVHITSTFSLEMHYMRPIARYRRSRNKMTNYLIFVDKHRQRKINISVLLALLLGFIMSAHIAKDSCVSYDCGVMDDLK